MRDVLKQIRPTLKEKKELHKITREIIKSIRIPRTKCMLGGSAAKGTWLRNNHDIDIYVKFDKKSYSGMDISAILGKKLKDAKVLHGSRDYFQLQKNSYTIELIPIINIKHVEDAENITDISPFHKTWVLRHKKYRNDILLAKAFAKANGFYGAESFIKGFSGYAMEVLAIHYKGFKNLLKNVAAWKSQAMLDTEKHHAGKIDINPAKMRSPLILIDPVQHSRNVTAVVSQEKYKKFIQAARMYLKKPRKEMFIKKEFSIEEIQKRKEEKIILELVPLEGKRDVVGAKLLKCFEYIREQLKEHDFELKDANWHWKEGENAFLYYILKNQELSPTVKHYGPPISDKERLKHFKETWRKYILKKERGKVYVLLPRKYSQPEELIVDLSNLELIKSRVKEIKI